MRTGSSDPWCRVDTAEIHDDGRSCHFEDSFVEYQPEYQKLSDSDDYLEKLCEYF